MRRLSLLVLPLALAAVLPSCSGDGTVPGGDGTPGSLGEALFSNDKTIYDYFVGKGLTNFQAAGIVGNLDQESGGDPTAVQAGGPGRGVAQWSVGGRWDTDANDNAMWFAAMQGQDVWSLQLQLDFIWYELNTFSGYGLSQLKATTNVTDATVVFQDKFEGCGACDQTKRVQYAMDVLNAYGSTPPPAYAAKFVSQTYPYASVGAIMLTVGQTVTGNIVMQNVGTATWKAGETKLAPMPRDQASPFQSPSWLSNNRVSTVTADVPPGQNGTFEWDFTGSAAGDFSPFFGFVEEGVTWFADPPMGGGPPDDQIQVHIVVMPSQGTGGGAGAGTAGAGTAGAGTAGAGQAGTTGTGGMSSGGSSGAPSTGGSAGKATGGSSTAGSSAGGHSGAPATGGSTSGGSGHGASGAANAGGAGGAIAAGGGGTGGSGGGGAVTLEDAGSESNDGCGCHLGRRPPTRAWPVALIAALAVLRRRRREK